MGHSRLDITIANEEHLGHSLTRLAVLHLGFQFFEQCRSKVQNFHWRQQILLFSPERPPLVPRPMATTASGSSTSTRRGRPRGSRVKVSMNFRSPTGPPKFIEEFQVQGLFYPSPPLVEFREIWQWGRQDCEVHARSRHWGVSGF